MPIHIYMSIHWAALERRIIIFEAVKQDMIPSRVKTRWCKVRIPSAIRVDSGAFVVTLGGLCIPVSALSLSKTCNVSACDVDGVRVFYRWPVVRRCYACTGPRGLTFTWWGCYSLCLTQTNPACPLLFILFLCLFLSLWLFQLYFFP